MTYREARSLALLLTEVNTIAPRRSTASDGWIGDAAHASRTSDHNPWVKDAAGVGVVRARDFTHSPWGGLDGNFLAEHIAGLLGQHPALGDGAYVIWDRRIISTARLAEGWRPYTGSNPHTAHVHVSVGLVGYDATMSWGLVAPVPPPKPTKPAAPSKVERARDLLRAARNASRKGSERRRKLNDLIRHPSWPSK